MATITHHGAVTGVTGSCHELTLANGESLLVDCGMFQGEEGDRQRTVAGQIDFPITQVKALIVTHCHIDHCGRIPWLLAAGYKGPIYATKATAALLPLVLEDAIKLGITRHEGTIQKILKRLKKQLRGHPYDHWFDLDPLAGEGREVRVRLRMAGHIMGSAYVECDVSDGGEASRVVFSGDLGAPYTPLLPAPKPPTRADVLVIESTYGDSLHEGRKDRRRRLQAVIEQSYRNGGTVIIPAFSIGRTQELLYEIEDIIHRHNSSDPSRALDWSQIDVVVDSPLAAAFTHSYRQLRELWDAEAKKRVSEGRHPLDFEQLITVDSHENHLKLVEHLKQSGRPAIVIAASGMCAGGRVVNYLKALLPDKRTDVIFVGYQAEGTPGRDIIQYGPGHGFVILDDERVEIAAAVHVLSGYSAHADQSDLLRFVGGIRKPPAEIRIVHGDPEAKEAFARKVAEVCPAANILIPG